MHAVLGTMTWGYSAQVRLPEAERQLELFVKLGGRMIDTARVYQFGETEQLIGELLSKRPDLASKVEIHTKAHPMVGPLDAKGVRAQLEASLSALRMSCVDLFYLHQPDVKVPLVETLRICNDLFREGKFKRLGLSSYAAWDCVNAHMLCERHGWVKPTTYQGIYNAISRSCEPELVPALRTLGMNLYVFNPLGAGMLTDRYRGKTSVNTPPQTGRFSADFDLVPASQAATNPMRGKAHQMYRTRYWREDVLGAIQMIHTALDDQDHKKTKDGPSSSTLQCAFSWLKNHSALIPNDGIIFGISSLSQLEENMNGLEWASTHTLSPTILNAIDGASSMVKHESYFRGYDAENGKAKEYLKRVLSNPPLMSTKL